MDEASTDIGTGLASYSGTDIGTGLSSESAKGVVYSEKVKTATLPVVPYTPDKVIIIKGRTFELSEVDISSRPSGTYGAVFRVKEISDPTTTLVFKCPTDLNNARQIASLRSEIEIYGRIGIGNEYLARTALYEEINVVRDGVTYTVPHLVMAWAEHGSLHSFMQRKPDAATCPFINIHPMIATPVSAVQYCARVFDIMLQLTLGLYHAHNCGVIHADLKPQNILVKFISEFDPEERNDMAFYNVAICDFGLSIGAVHGVHMVPLGTGGYRPPEQELRPDKVTNKIDVFTLAKVILHLLLLYVQRTVPSAVILLPHICDWLLNELGERVGAMFADLLKSCSALNPDDRPDIDAVLDVLVDGITELGDLIDDDGQLLFRSMLITSRQTNNDAADFFLPTEERKPDELIVAETCIYSAIGLYRNYELLGSYITELFTSLGAVRRSCAKFLNLDECKRCSELFSQVMYCPVDAEGSILCRSILPCVTYVCSRPGQDGIHLNKVLQSLSHAAQMLRDLGDFSGAWSLYDMCCHCSNEAQLDHLRNFCLLASRAIKQSYNDVIVARLQMRYQLSLVHEPSDVDILIHYASFLHRVTRQLTEARTFFATAIELMDQSGDDSSEKFQNTVIQFTACLTDIEKYTLADHI
jgi:serine/threonine protein kinase